MTIAHFAAPADTRTRTHSQNPALTAAVEAVIDLDRNMVETARSLWTIFAALWAVHGDGSSLRVAAQRCARKHYGPLRSPADWLYVSEAMLLDWAEGVTPW